MNTYKPEYLGKVIPTDDPSKMADFVENRYDAFSKVYDVCKTQSDGISDIKAVDTKDSNALSVQIIANPDTVQKIKEKVEDDQSVTVQDSVITAKP